MGPRLVLALGVWLAVAVPGWAQGAPDRDAAIAAIQEIEADPLRHSKAARKTAEECFDSDQVLGRVLGELGGR